MSRTPFHNALAAISYIVLVASLIYNAQFFVGVEKGIIIPIAFLSLFVFSAAVMGFIFLYQPLQLLLEGQKNEAVTLFLKTVATFAGITIVLVSTWSFLSSMYY